MAASAADDSKRLAEVKKNVKGKPGDAEKVYKEILTQSRGTSDAAMKNLEVALLGLGELYRDQRRVEELADLILQTRQALSSFAKAKTAKLGLFIEIYVPPSC